MTSAEGERNEATKKEDVPTFLNVMLERMLKNITCAKDHFKLTNDINNKWFEGIANICNYDKNACSNYYSNLNVIADVT